MLKVIPPFLQLKSGSRRARVLLGHPWVFAGEVEHLLPPAHDGQAVSLVDSRGRFLGRGIYNSQSQIIWRRFSDDITAEWDRGHLAAALDRALARRPAETCRRLVWSESDDLPGYVVEQFGDVLVIQSLTLAADLQAKTLAELLVARLQPREILFRHDAPARQHEGLTRQVFTLSGRPLAAGWVETRGLNYRLDLMGGQKTGFYLDQRDEHLRVAAHASGRRILDAFCNQGGFALQAARAGARSVLGLDISAECVSLARENARENGLEVTFEEANVFDWFTANREASFDLIVLDPPSFARNKAAVDGALRGYKELNLRALRMLGSNGLLATYSCSQNVSREAFFETLAEAAHDARRTVHIIAETGQPADHPVRLGFPESHYLKGALLRVL